MTFREAVVSQTRHAIRYAFIRYASRNGNLIGKATVLCEFRILCLCVQYVRESIIGSVTNDFCIHCHAHGCQ